MLVHRQLEYGNTNTQSMWMNVGGRVAPGRCLPGAPTDPDMQNSRIRLFG